MPAGKRGRPRKAPEAEEEGLEGVQEPETPAALELEDDVIGELGDDDGRYIVAVWRRVESGPRVGKAEYLYRLSPAEFSLDAVRDRSGGGTYEFRVLRRDDRGKEKYHRTRTMHVAGAPRAIVTEGSAPAGAPVAIVPAPQSEELRAIREEMERSRRRNARLRRELEELRRSKTPSLLKELAPILAPILAPFFKPAKSGTEEFVRALELGVKLGNRGNGDDGGALGPIIDKALGVVTTIAQQHPNGASSQTAPGLLPGSQAAPGSAAAPPPAVAKVVPLWIQRAAPYFPVLLSWAKAGDDPAARVGFVLGALDEQTRDELGKACEADDFVANTLGALPPHFREPNAVTWTTRFLQLVQEELAPEEEPA